MKTSGRWGWWVAIAMLVCLAIGGWTPALRAADPNAGDEVPTEINVPISVRLSHESMAAGGEAVLAVIYDVPPDAHIQVNDFFYASPKEGEPFSLGEVKRTAPIIFEEEPVHIGRTVAYYPLRLTGAPAAGKHELHLLAGYQACIEKPVFACFAPVDVELTIPVEVSAGGEVRLSSDAVFASLPAGISIPGGGTPPPGISPTTPPRVQAPELEASIPPASAAPTAEPSEQTGLAGRLEQAMASKSLLAFLLVFLGGILTSFTPCVYPMIPITISYIGGQAKGRLAGFVMSLFFVLGIAIMYSVLGVIAASTGALFGNAMQSMPVIIVVSAVFFAMGASMLGVFDLALPSGMQTKLQSGPRTGVIGALFMGMVTGIVASPCVGPVLVVLLTQIAKMGSIVLGFTYLFTFALGLGMLFLVLGTFAGALASLPQAGGWMDTVKHLFGVILLAMGIFYLRGLLGPNWTAMLLGAFAVFVGTYTGAFHPLEDDPPKSRMFRKGLGIVLALVGAFLLLSGLARQTGWSAPSGGTTAASSGAAAKHPGPAWVMDDVAGLARAKAEGKPAFIDFYADWCTACKELDHKTWPDPGIVAEAERFVAIKLDFTKKDPANTAKQASYGVAGLPTVIFYDASGREVKRFFGFKGPEEVRELLAAVR